MSVVFYSLHKLCMKWSVRIVNVLFVIWQLIIMYLALDLRLSDHWVSSYSLEQVLNLNCLALMNPVGEPINPNSFHH